MGLQDGCNSKLLEYDEDQSGTLSFDEAFYFGSAMFVSKCDQHHLIPPMVLTVCPRRYTVAEGVINKAVFFVQALYCSCNIRNKLHLC